MKPAPNVQPRVKNTHDHVTLVASSMAS